MFEVGLLPLSWRFPCWLENWTANLLWRMKWGTERKPSITKGPENSLRVSVYIICRKCLFADSIFTTNISHNASIWGTLACLRHIIRQKLQTRPLTPSSCAAMWWPIIGFKTFLFKWKNDGYAKKSSLNHGKPNLSQILLTNVIHWNKVKEAIMFIRLISPSIVCYQFWEWMILIDFIVKKCCLFSYW